MSVITLVVATSALAQTQPAADGFTLQERAGIVLVKPQAWSKDSEAVVVEFQAFTDRTASGSSGAGYIEFKTKATDARQIPKAKIVKMVVYPDPKLVTEIITQKDRDSLDEVATELKGTVAKFPSTRTYVEPALKKVSEEVAIYDSGKVKTGGNWVNKDVYIAERARTYVAQIRADIVNAEPPSSFDLASDPRYIALEDMAKTNPSVKPLATELSNLYGKRVRSEQRTALLAKLADPEINLADAKGAVARLKSLQPDTDQDARSVNFLKNWDAAIAKVATIQADGKKLAASLETEMAAVKAEDAIPQISPDLDKQIGALSVAVSSVASSKQTPAPLLTEIAQAQAVSATAGAFGKLKAIIEARQYLEAKDVLDSVSVQTSKIGPETTRVVLGLSRTTAASISEFSRLREEGQVQANANKPAEALAAYEKAYAVIPDPAVGEQIAQLKEKLPKKK